MADTRYRVELTASFRERLEAIEAFLIEADTGFAFAALVAALPTGAPEALREYPHGD